MLSKKIINLEYQITGLGINSPAPEVIIVFKADQKEKIVSQNGTVTY